jgi:iron(III) transport system ATP-binding protein
MGSRGPLWTLKGISLYGTDHARLDEVSVEIHPGVTAILGHSGSGKTSLLNLLVGFEKPDRGEIALDIPQQNSAGLPLFWSPHDDGLWGHLTVKEHLETVAPRGKDGSNRVEILLAAFDLSNKSGWRTNQLSRGECSRLTVARACASQARVLVLDEPLVHVDHEAAGRYWRQLLARPASAGPMREKPATQERTHEEDGSLVFSTHAPEVVMREATRVICLSEGRVTYSGEVDRLYNDPPSADLAWRLGPANWIEPAEAERWLAGAQPNSACIRPERLAVARAQAGPLVVESCSFAGSIAEVAVCHEPSGQRKTLYHRPQGALLRAGDRVAATLLAMLLLMMTLTGCGTADADPNLPIRSTRTWTIPAHGMSIPAPRAVYALPNEEILVLDNVGRVLAFDTEGKLVRHWWMPDYSVGRPEKICLLRDGRLAIADTHYHRVVFFDLAGNVVGTQGSYGREPGEFVYPVAVVQDDDDNYYVCEYGENDRIQKFRPNGEFVLQFGRPGTEPGEFQRPSGVAFHEGRLYVVDAFNNRIQVFSKEGEFLEILGGEKEAVALHYPYDIGINPQGEVFVVEYGAGRVTKLDLNGKLLGRYGNSGSGEGQLNRPWGLALDRRSRVYVADTENRRVVRLQL